MKEGMIVGDVACIGELGNTQRILARIHEGKGLLGRRKCRWVVSISIYLWLFWGMQRSWLRYCATNWKVVGLIPDGFAGVFH
jgi:hypothetical protein